ncbi:unnamed protein product [Miscanthus lutarioriparius]|uniref:Uncharacterized protein n=1 Tax=Miscanthus lutarioriparius TaxID=422564 RepID=A0A811N091_9POAL|nr:unnamed protein product [Miscanthus lutarioriparius]
MAAEPMEDDAPTSSPTAPPSASRGSRRASPPCCHGCARLMRRCCAEPGCTRAARSRIQTPSNADGPALSRLLPGDADADGTVVARDRSSGRHPPSPAMVERRSIVRGGAPGDLGNLAFSWSAGTQTSILIRMSGNGRRGRRLTLAPVACRALRPSAQSMEDDDSDLDEEDGHGEPPLADVTGKCVVPPTTDDEPFTPEFIKEALEAGLYVKENQWRRQERVLVAISVGVEVAGVRPSTPVFNRVSTQGLPGEVAATISFTLVDEDEAMEGKPAMATTTHGHPATWSLGVVVGLKAENLQATAIPCGYAVEGMGFYFIPVIENPKLPSDDKSAVGPMDTKTVKGKIRFEKGAENDVFKHEIDKKNGRARLKVAVFNLDLIPDLVDVVIGDFVYELQFRVEKDMPDGESQVIDMDSTMVEDKAPEEKEPENMDHDANKTADDPAGKAPGKQTNASVAPNGQHKSKAVTGASTESMVMAAKLAGAAGVQQDLAATVGAILQHSNLEVTESASVGEKSTYKPVVPLSPCGMILDGSAQWKASLLQSKTLNGGAVSPVRARKRNVSTLDQDSLERR